MWQSNAVVVVIVELEIYRKDMIARDSFDIFLLEDTSDGLLYLLGDGWLFVVRVLFLFLFLFVAMKKLACLLHSGQTELLIAVRSRF